LWLNSTLLPAECSRTSNTGINGYQTKTYGYEGATGFKTVGFRSNAPAGPYWLDGENRVGQFGGGDDTLWSRSGPSRGDNYFDFTAFNISRVHSLLEGLIVRMPEITTTNYLSGSSAYTLTNPSVDLFTIERDYYSFSLEDSTSQQASRVVFYLNESSQLAVDFESSLVSRTVTPSQSDVSVPEPQTGIILAMGVMLLLLRRRR